jgi:hypothetical protein
MFNKLADPHCLLVSWRLALLTANAVKLFKPEYKDAINSEA